MSIVTIMFVRATQAPSLAADHGFYGVLLARNGIVNTLYPVPEAGHIDWSKRYNVQAGRCVELPKIMWPDFVVQAIAAAALKGELG